jgi:hypothetical protein
MKGSSPANRLRLTSTCAALLAALLCGAPPARAAELEADAWPEIDVWIKMDEQSRDRIYILISFTEEPSYQYQETALGISWDQRFHEHWSWRAGIRYIDKQVDPPDKGETRAVFDLKWFQKLGPAWLLTNRNRVDVRWFDGDSFGDPSFRYRNRTQFERPLRLLSHDFTGFASYEFYYDSRYDEWGQRQRVIAGVSVPVVERFSVDVFGAYHIETEPKVEDGEALGIAFGLYF